MRKYILLGISLVSLLYSCSTPLKLLNKGRYQSAVKASIRQIEKGKDTLESSVVLIEAMDQIINRSRLTLLELVNSEEPRNWKKAIKNAKKLNRQLYTIGPYTNNHYDYLVEELDLLESDMVNRLYQFYVMQADERLEYYKITKSKKAAQEAYYHYRNACDYAPNQYLIERLMEECIFYGTNNYLVEAYSVNCFGLDWEIDRVFGEVEGLSSRFEEINYKRGHPSDMDAIISVKLYIDESRVRKTVKRKEFSEKVIVRNQQEFIDTSGQVVITPIYETIFGEVDIITLKKQYDIEARIIVVNNSNELNLFNCYIQEEAEVVHVYNELRKNHDAIPDEYKGNNTRKPRFSDEEVYEDLLEKIYSRMKSQYF